MKVNFENLSNESRVTSLSSIKHLRFKIEHFEQSPVELKDVVVFPGLINSHDHLEFNLFPCLANKVYENYTEWGKDIHLQNKSEITSVLRIPIELRIRWGILKNLLTGVTYIVHHGGHHDVIKSLDYPVYLNYQYLHALATEPYWKLKLLLPKKEDVMVHIGEGTSKESNAEINQILKWNLWRRNVIGIHAISMEEQQSKKFKAIVWCPDSNLRLYKKTANIVSLKKHTNILFGTDSALSASSNIWEHLRLARNLKMLSDEEIFESLVKHPGDVFGDMDNKGIVIARKNSSVELDSFFELNPEDLLMIVINDTIKLIDHSLAEMPIEKYSLIRVGRSKKWLPNAMASVVSELEMLGVKLPLQVKSVAL